MKATQLKKWGLLALLLVLSMALFLGCNTANKANTNKTDESQTEQAGETKDANSEAEGTFPITLTDGTGQEVTIEEKPKKIISLVASNTEIAFALGLGDKIVGVSDWCNYPAEALEKEKLGGQEINVEKILSLSPDLALLSMYHYKTYPDTVTQFKEAGINVLVVVDATSFDDVYTTMQLIAKATGTADKAEEIITDMQKSLDELKNQAQAVTEKKKVWVEVSPSPDVFTTGKNTFMHEMLEAIQAVNVAGDQTGWVKYTEEEAVQLNPDVIITTYGYYVDQPAEQVLQRAGWAEVPAIKNKQVFDVDNDTVTRPGPRLIDGVETLAKLIYPEIFH